MEGGEYEEQERKHMPRERKEDVFLTPVFLRENLITNLPQGGRYRKGKNNTRGGRNDEEKLNIKQTEKNTMPTLNVLTNNLAPNLH